MYIGQHSIDIEEELSSAIYKVANEDGYVYYYYDEPRNELETHDEREIGCTISWNPNNVPIAIIHTHGAYDAETDNAKDGFSYPGNALRYGTSDTEDSDKLGMNYYVVTPAGNLYKYDTGSGNYAGTLLRSDMPVDSHIVIQKKTNDILLLGLPQCIYFILQLI